MSEHPHYCVSCGAAVTRRAEVFEAIPWFGAVTAFVLVTVLLPEAFPEFWWAFDYNLRFATFLLSCVSGFLAWFILRDVRMKFRLRYGYTLHQISH
jgi:hypothetical protein